MIQALCQELELRKDEFRDEVVETLYFGGGTPSVLETEEIRQIIDAVYENYTISNDPEITLEANPDDLSEEKIKQLSRSPINRLSIGIQSFFDEDLKWMNRAHTAQQSVQMVSLASRYFDNVSIDLIYGIPGMGNGRWIQNIEKALSLNVPHISSYALTVEPKTALAGFIKKGIVEAVEDEMARQQHSILVELLEAKGFVNYEISNFGRPGYFSRNNTAYWQGKKYIGIGPSAHSYNGRERSWNINNNTKYIAGINSGELPKETEMLTPLDRYNEYVMTGLRTISGVSLSRVKNEFGPQFQEYLLRQARKYVDEQLLRLNDDNLVWAPKGKFLIDGIAADLFMVNLGE